MLIPFLVTSAALSGHEPDTPPIDRIQNNGITLWNTVLQSEPDNGKVVYADTGETITGSTNFSCWGKGSRVVVGLEGVDMRHRYLVSWSGWEKKLTEISDGVGPHNIISRPLWAGDKGTFSLVAPQVPGVYQVRFCCGSIFGGLESPLDWWGTAQFPGPEATFGLVIVKGASIDVPITDENWKDWLQEAPSIVQG